MSNAQGYHSRIKEAGECEKAIAERDSLREKAERGFRAIKRVCSEARSDKGKIEDITYIVKIELEELEETDG